MTSLLDREYLMVSPLTDELDSDVSVHESQCCETCGGDGKETCTNPDHGFIDALSFTDIGRIGCPACGTDPRHKVKGGGKCEDCNGTGKRPPDPACHSTSPITTPTHTPVADSALERAQSALREIYEVYAGSESFIPETAPEAYLQRLLKQMADIAGAALGKDGQMIHEPRRIADDNSPPTVNALSVIVKALGVHRTDVVIPGRGELFVCPTTGMSHVRFWRDGKEFKFQGKVEEVK